MKELFQREPARLIGHSISLLIAILALLTSFGVNITGEQSMAMSAVLTAIMVLVSGGTEMIRGTVYSPKTVEEIIEVERTPLINTKPPFRDNT